MHGTVVPVSVLIHLGVVTPWYEAWSDGYFASHIWAHHEILELAFPLQT